MKALKQNVLMFLCFNVLMIFMRYRSTWILALILIIGFFVRLYRINAPLGDWHSWRQADTAAVTREYVQNGIDLLRPRYMDLSSIPSGKDNPQGWRMVEFPVVNGLAAGIIREIGGIREIEGIGELVVWERLVSIVFSLGSIVFLFLIAGRLSGERVGLIAAAVMAVLPYNIYYSRVILPEVPLVFFSLAALYFSVRYFLSDKHSVISVSFWLSAGCAAIALLLKPYAIFLAFPILYLGWKQCRTDLLKSIKSYVWLALVILPFLLWRVWISQFPEGTPAFTWLLNGNGIRFKGAFFRWIFADRLGRLILGYFGLFPLGIGLIVKPTDKEGWFYRWWGLGILAYLTVFATGNVQHDYYQIITIPIISIYVAKGIDWLLKPPPAISRSASYGAVAVTILFTLAFGWFHIRDYFNINHPEIVEAGRAADRVVPPAARVIAPYDGDTAFLFQTNRKGWPIGGAIDDKISKGATHYASVRFDEETRELMEKCQVMVKTEKYVIIDLGKCSD